MQPPASTRAEAIPAVEPFELVLADGRVLAGATFGPRDGAPLFYFHGLPGCRSEPELFADPTMMTELGIRMIALERPGYGASHPRPGRTVRDWASDVAAAADHLGVERFAVVGYSGGGAYALACAHALSERVTKATVIEGLGPFDGGALGRLAWWHPQRVMLQVGAVLGPVLTMTAWLIAYVGRTRPRWLIAMMSGSDRALVVRKPEVATWMSSGLFGASLCQGNGAVVHELRLAIRPWGFPLEDIRVPVHFIHGKDDGNCPPQMAEAMHARVSGSTLTLLDDAGHLVIFERARELLGAAVR